MKWCCVQLFFAIFISGFAVAHDGQGQVLQTRISLSLDHVSFENALAEIERLGRVKFVYSPDQINLDEPVSVHADGEVLEVILNRLLVPLDIKYSVYEGERMITLKRKRAGSDQLKSDAGTVNGQVLDGSSRVPLAGVNVVIKGTTRGTATDSDGRYSLQVDDDDVLIFSFIGYAVFETRVEGRSVVDVILQEDIQGLDEVTVNAGYWTVSEKENTGNISRITSEAIRQQPVSNPLQAMQGRMPGVYIEQYSGVPGSNFKVQVRGRNSLQSGTNPLYIINGVPFISETLSSDNTAYGIYQGAGASPLNGINPDDIESIEVLKDADATAIYGSRGANGVILITTKKGKAGKLNIDANVSTGFSRVTRRVDLLNTQDFLTMRKEAVRNDEAQSVVDDDPLSYPDLTQWDSARYTDWQKTLIGGTARFTNAQLSFSGGSELAQFFLSGGYQNQSTVFPGSNTSQRGSYSFSLTQHSKDKRFRAELNSSYVLSSSNLLGSDLTAVSMFLAPHAPALYDSAGNLNWENSTWVNPLAQRENRFRSGLSNLVNNLTLRYELLKDLDVNVRAGATTLRNEERFTVTSASYDPAIGMTPLNTVLRVNAGVVDSWIVEPQLNWKRKLGDGVLTAMVGATFQHQVTRSLQEAYTGFSSDALADNPRSAASAVVEGYVDNEYRYSAGYGRLNYSFKDRYIVNATFRRDGSSRFGIGNQFSNFGAVGAAWIFSRENVVQQVVPFLSHGKLRASYGTTGNDQIGDYNYLDTYDATSPYGGVPGLIPSRLYNSNFAWEVNKKFESGLELGFFEDRISLSASYFRNRSSNQLVNYKLPSTAGFTSILRNLDAVIDNNGWEFELTAVNVAKTNFRWTTSFNLTVQRNVLVEFPDLENSNYATIFVVGEPLNIRKVYHYTGIDSAGVYQFEDINGDGQISSLDQQYVGRSLQHYYGGVNNTVRYKGFSLSFLFQFVKQTKPFVNTFSVPGLGENQPQQVFNSRWTEQNTNGSYQRFTILDDDVMTAQFRYENSDAGFVDASFVRLKNVSLSWELPAGWTKRFTARFYVQGQNLLTITDFKGLDPETGSSFVLPPLTTVTGGVQITL